MKHTLPVTLILVTVFVLSQLIGLTLISIGTEVSTDEQGNVIVEHDQPAFAERPDTQGFASFTYLIIGLAVGTIMLLILIRFRLFGVWKLWFFLAVLAAMTIAIGTLIDRWVALGIAGALAVWKIWRPNIWVHNITEVLVYSGIAILIAPIFSLFYAALLLFAIAVYDAWAVWRSKHMVKMAQFQTESKLFAGLFIPYGKTEQKTSVRVQPGKASKSATAATKAPKPAEGGRNAILGGGDIAFPLLFAAVVFSTLVSQGLTKAAAFGYTLFVVAGATAALALLFTFAKKDAFYPAMPFISAGCFVGYGLVWLVQLVL